MFANSLRKVLNISSKSVRTRQNKTLGLELELDCTLWCEDFGVQQT